MIKKEGHSCQSAAIRAVTQSMLLSFEDVQRNQRLRTQRYDALRWGTSCLIVFTLTGLAGWWALHLPPIKISVPEAPPPAIAIDLAPEPVSVIAPPTDVPPGPQQTLTSAEPVPEEKPDISAPPSPAVSPPVLLPKPGKVKKNIKKHEAAPKIKHPAPEKPDQAEVTTAPPATQAPEAQAMAAPTPGVSSSHAAHDPVKWQNALLAQLEKFKRYPSEAMLDHQEGVPTVTFSMDRKGHILTVALASSSGNSLLDQEALALPKRAQPLPVPPDSIEGDIVTLTVPVEFYIHED